MSVCPQAVQWFWKVVHGLQPEQQKQLLFFVTGSDRVPIKGLASLTPPFTISRAGPHSDRLPTAHTCFNHLLLPDYQVRPHAVLVYICWLRTSAAALCCCAVAQLLPGYKSDMLYWYFKTQCVALAQKQSVHIAWWYFLGACSADATVACFRCRQSQCVQHNVVLQLSALRLSTIWVIVLGCTILQQAWKSCLKFRCPAGSALFAKASASLHPEF